MAGNPQVINLTAGAAGAPLIAEAVAASGFTSKPGTFITLDTSGDVVVSGADAPAKWIAMNDPTSARDIDTAYAAGDLVRYGKFQPGQEAYCWLADGETVTPASKLSTDASGNLVVTTAEANIVAQSNESFTASGVTRIKVTIL